MADNPRIEELRRRVQADPASIAFAALAEEYRRARRFEEAIETCRTGLQRHPSYLSARVTLGRSLLEVQQYEEARKELEYVLKAAPENLAAIRALAEIHERRGDSPENYEEVTAAAAAHEASQAAAPSPTPAAEPSPVEWALPKVAPPAPAVTLERIAVSAVQERADEAPAVAAPPVQASAVQAPPAPDPNKEILEGLNRFLASIQAARRTISSERSRVVIR